MAITRKVLIVDDNINDVGLIQSALINTPCHFELADNLQDAIDRTPVFEPAAILLDVNIPPFRNGIGCVPFSDILGFIRKFRENYPVLILTGNGTPDHIGQALEAGACDYINKNKLMDRHEFETRFKQAILLHDAQRLKQDNIDIKMSLVHLRANQELLITQQQSAKEDIMKEQKLAAQKVGEVQDKKEQLLRKQAYIQAVADRDAYWKKRIFALMSIVGWGLIGAIKVALERLLGGK